ncbi:tRNA 5-methoxyuridine(34)/uridine 5-oxyacetic acid(34) synthase CmoB [Marinobacter sp. M3C]|jgi:tRNA (mo5U34)-methyltransferase|uniref:tRNA 5-methoxyuridine(34)/uridine 5-oxyacetic acid(34) synthase CmoB n=1 Tax=unclassified Marinobacter TaxID=83889 RepID=UPI00200E843E|nr:MULTISPECIES: tRNA 5-methoxyuridine(34)/uridine 5-oxyacetic acid(34) synthase CmoB [unclassified Marinobacter]MCL1477534.1 tRNA 5-methoxyuridine(34)/uridine 5-oxyacetic acid(34) synthase CmoB [Marinobacter sp.]MCL1481639.1 tRNA 5-methoxyuridine(34)/uridine 5-oxyacetic acid(34) synthase CmoB [Marinobacter sp.]MCL1483352.1 tRNA 5-methoxyuridine(34)/uridine 5-oxyacetic acid(34) synthase CmoB [Marinobacter sp.]MCL1487046.1 tRNA 5-methoxyuridine(34)/uridine 5-oxyacetic acid(34) synthase CmoB [Mar
MSYFNWQTCYNNLFEHLEQQNHGAWATQIRQQLTQRFDETPHGDVPRWQSALNLLPTLPNVQPILDAHAVTLRAGQTLAREQSADLETGLRGLMPWRKGPFDFFGTAIDTEWRSDWKWDRVAPFLTDLHGRQVLDVGCGSGYHCWRMHGAGAARVIGIDPGLLFLFQFLAVKNYLTDVPVDLLPLRIEDLPPKLQAFDTTFSMGVLYHRRSPLDHLLELKDTLRNGGELVLETLVIDGPEGASLMPEDRYGQMRNVWFLPSCATLLRWLDRCGFVNARVVDVTATSTEEQRSTDWMRFNSLQDFLDPDDPKRTIEGYPGPLRATLIANKPS